jgi:hypothetical protein
MRADDFSQHRSISGIFLGGKGRGFGVLRVGAFEGRAVLGGGRAGRNILRRGDH